MAWGPQIFIKLLSGKHLSFWKENKSEYTVKKLKNEIFKKTKLPSTWQYFVYNGKPFSDNNLHLLNDLNIQKEATLHLLLRWHGVGCPCPACNHIMILRNNKKIKMRSYNDYVKKSQNYCISNDIIYN